MLFHSQKIILFSVKCKHIVSPILSSLPSAVPFRQGVVEKRETLKGKKGFKRLHNGPSQTCCQWDHWHKSKERKEAGRLLPEGKRSDVHHHRQIHPLSQPAVPSPLLAYLLQQVISNLVTHVIRLQHSTNTLFKSCQSVPDPYFIRGAAQLEWIVCLISSLNRIFCEKHTQNLTAKLPTSSLSLSVHCCSLIKLFDLTFRLAYYDSFGCQCKKHPRSLGVLICC